MAWAASQATGTPRAGHNFGAVKKPSVCAVTVGLNAAKSQEKHWDPYWQNTYSDIFKRLRDFGFERHQSSAYFGDDSVGGVHCISDAPSLVREFDWFEPSITDTRMLRIKDNNDLLPAVR